MSSIDWPSIALESNFYSQWDTPQFLALEQRYACQFVQVVCTAPGPLLVERYERRARSGERHPGHTDAAALREVLPRLLNEHWDALELEGPVFVVDTADWRIDLDSLVHKITMAVAHPALTLGPQSSSHHDAALPSQ